MTLSSEPIDLGAHGREAFGDDADIVATLSVRMAALRESSSRISSISSRSDSIACDVSGSMALAARKRS